MEQTELVVEPLVVRVGRQHDKVAKINPLKDWEEFEREWLKLLLLQMEAVKEGLYPHPLL